MNEENPPENMKDDFANASEQTLVDKAFEELEELHHFISIENTTPPEMIAHAKRAHKVIDTYIDRPGEEKEALKALVVLKFGFPFLFDDTRRFKDRYNQQLSDMVDELLQTKYPGNNADNIMQIRLALIAARLEKEATALNDPVRAKSFGLETREEAISKIVLAMTDILQEPGSSSAPRLLEHTMHLMAQNLALLRTQPAADRPAPPQP